MGWLRHISRPASFGSSKAAEATGRQLTFCHGSGSFLPHWSPDGQRIALACEGIDRGIWKIWFSLARWR